MVTDSSTKSFFTCPTQHTRISLHTLLYSPDMFPHAFQHSPTHPPTPSPSHPQKLLNTHHSFYSSCFSHILPNSSKTICNLIPISSVITLHGLLHRRLPCVCWCYWRKHFLHKHYLESVRMYEVKLYWYVYFLVCFLVREWEYPLTSHIPAVLLCIINSYSAIANSINISTLLANTLFCHRPDRNCWWNIVRIIATITPCLCKVIANITTYAMEFLLWDTPHYG